MLGFNTIQANYIVLTKKYYFLLQKAENLFCQLKRLDKAGKIM